MKKVLQKSTMLWLLESVAPRMIMNSGEVAAVKEEVEQLKQKQMQLLGKDLNGMGLNEIQELENLQADGLLSVKERKEQLQLPDQLEQSKMKRFGRCRGSTSAIFATSSTITIPKTFQLDAFNLDIMVDEIRDYISNIGDITIQEQGEEVEFHSHNQLVCHIYISLLHENSRRIKHRKEVELRLSHISAGKTKRESAVLLYELQDDPETFCYYGPCYAPCQRL